MSRNATAEEIEAILGLLASAGSVAEFRRWIALARRRPRRPRGRPKGKPKYPDDLLLLLAAGIIQQSSSQTRAIKHVVATCCGDDGVLRHGASVGAVEKRLAAKLNGQSLADFTNAWFSHPETRTFRFNSPQPPILSE